MTQVREVGMWLKDYSFKSLYLTKVDTTGPPLLYVYISRTTHWSKSEQWHHLWIDLNIPSSAWSNRALYLTSDDHLSWEFRGLHNDPWHDTPFILNTYTPSYHKPTPSHAVRCTIIYNWGVVWWGDCCASTPISRRRVCACGFITIVASERTWIQCDSVETHCNGCQFIWKQVIQNADAHMYTCCFFWLQAYDRRKHGHKNMCTHLFYLTTILPGDCPSDKAN